MLTADSWNRISGFSSRHSDSALKNGGSLHSGPSRTRSVPINSKLSTLTDTVSSPLLADRMMLVSSEILTVMSTHIAPSLPVPSEPALLGAPLAAVAAASGARTKATAVMSGGLLPKSSVDSARLLRKTGRAACSSGSSSVSTEASIAGLKNGHSLAMLSFSQLQRSASENEIQEGKASRRSCMQRKSCACRCTSALVSCEEGKMKRWRRGKRERERKFES